MGNNKKRKTAATVGAVTLAAALVLTGTYAWNSISQKAKNENIVYANPGGRLHDDWNGVTPSEGVKQVYVENFTGKDKDGSEDKNAAPIYVRVKLQTYMEFGEDAGKTTDAEGTPLESRKATPLVAGTEISDPDKWPVYIYGQSDAFQSYVEMKTETGKQLDYMPTFNKNKESLMADINGTYEGTSSEDEKYFDDFVDYSDQKNQTKNGTEYWYKEGADNKVTPITSTTVPGTDAEYEEVASKEHKAAKTLETKKIITMDEWLDYDGKTSGQEKNGDYWIYDEDGWAYWANPVDPSTATGPLLTNVNLKQSALGDSCYYAINVTGEFASAGDWGEDNGEAKTGFHKNGITDNALTLLNTISETVGVDWVDVTATSAGATVDKTKSMITVEPGATVNFTGKTTLMGAEVANQEIEWALDGVAAKASSTATLEKSGNGAKLTIPEDLPAQTLKVTATPKANKNAVATYKVKVAGPDKVTITNSEDRVAPGGTLTLTASVTKGGDTYSSQNVTWSVKPVGGEEKDEEPLETNEWKVSASETSGTTYVVVARSVNDEEVLAEKEIRVTNSTLPLATLKTIDEVKVTEDGVLEGNKVGPNNSILGNANNTKTIEIDGVSFFVIAKKEGKALLLSEKKLKERPVLDESVDNSIRSGEKTSWAITTTRAYLNSVDMEGYKPIDKDGNVDNSRVYNTSEAGWLADKSILAEVAIKTELKTPRRFDAILATSEEIDVTKDKIFLLSEADVFGTLADIEEKNVPESFYTVTKSEDGLEKGVKLVAPNGTWIAELGEDILYSDYQSWWLRSPRENLWNFAFVDFDGARGGAIYSGKAGGMRPACWVDL